MKRKQSSTFPGVCLHPSGKWVARATVNGTRQHLGRYRTEVEACERTLEFWADWLRVQKAEDSVKRGQS